MDLEACRGPTGLTPLRQNDRGGRGPSTRGEPALLEQVDALILSGGSSAGLRDLTAGVLTSLGAEILFHGISVRPGEPTILARLGAKPLLGMPGVPTSATVIFDAFVLPAVVALGW